MRRVGILVRISMAVVCLLCVGVAVIVVRRASANRAVFVIDHGGTFTGTWTSDDARQPCVRIATVEPVVIENATLRGPGDLIVSNAHQAKITIRNTTGVSLNPNMAGKCAGRFANIEQFASVTIENCSMDNTAGIYLLDYAGDGTPQQTVRILRNRAHNIDGRKSDGRGGYTPEFDLVQFAQLDKVRHVAGIEIAWNQVVNDPGASRVEDNISIYLSSGTKESPIRIHDNFIRGAYPIDPTKQQFSGGGIMLSDGVSKEGSDSDSGFVIAEKNQVLDTTNYGIAISAGHDCNIRANRIVSAGVLENGKPIAAQNVGAYVWDSYKGGPKRFFRNIGSDNVIGWMKGTKRNDWWRPNALLWENNTNWPRAITYDVYAKEWQAWHEKLNAAGVVVGPITQGPATTQSLP